MISSSLHERTKAVKPNQYTKPSTYWAAVLWFDREPAGPKREEDYLWIKCKGVSVSSSECCFTHSCSGDSSLGE
jgi:hypothetical protein